MKRGFLAWYAVVWLFRVIALIALILVLFVGCGSWHGTGTVVQKDYDAAWVQSTITCHPIGSKGATVCIPETHYWPEDFRLKIRDDVDKKTHWVSVSESEYSSASVGGTFSNGETK